MKSLSCSHWKCPHGFRMEWPNTFFVATLKLLTAPWRGDFFHELREVRKLGAHHWMKAMCLSQSKRQSPNFLVHQLCHSHLAVVRKDNGSPVCIPGPHLRAFWEMWVRSTSLSCKRDATSPRISCILQLWETVAAGPVWFRLLQEYKGSSLSLFILEIFWVEPFLTFPG